MSRPERRESILGLLSFASGAIDAVSFVSFGVFTSAMSGNTVLLGIAIGQLRLAESVAPVLAFLGYGLGVVLGTILPVAGDAKQDPASVLRRPLAVETALLAGFALLQVPAPLAAFPREVAILLAATGMGVQGATARLIRSPGVSTVVFTSTLTSVVGALASAAFGKAPRRITADTWLQAVMFVIYLTGAGASAALLHFGRSASALPAACIAVAAALSHFRRDWA